MLIPLDELVSFFDAGTGHFAMEGELLRRTEDQADLQAQNNQRSRDRRAKRKKKAKGRMSFHAGFS